MAALSQEYALIVRDLARDLDLLAVRTARLATDQAQRKLDQTARRRPTGKRPGLRDLIHSEPLRVTTIPTGAVGIGRIDLLDQAIDPRNPNYGTYWWAQEEGYDHRGRILKGFFLDAGFTAPAVPDPRLSGVGRQPIFQFDQGGGFGTVQHAIQPRRFLNYGARTAAARWNGEFNAIMRKTVRRLVAAQVTPPVFVPLGRRGRRP